MITHKDISLDGYLATTRNAVKLAIDTVKKNGIEYPKFNGVKVWSRDSQKSTPDFILHPVRN